MARVITAPELALLRSEGQWSELYMAVLVPNVIYTARLASLPSSNDQVYEITYNTGSGTLGDVKAGMLLYVGTTAGAYDLGFCRVRVAPDGTKIYIGETSEINWQSNCYLTIVDDFDLWPRHIHVDEDGGLLMDVNIPYVDQHSAFDPVPVLGSHAVLWLTGVTVDVDFDASDSWVFDSTIASYAWTAPGASASSGMATATPTITYNAAGIYRVYCLVTSAAGKTTTGIRYVFVYDDDNPPATVFQLANCEGSVDSGGWMFDVTMQAEATLSEIRAQTLVVLFAKDYYENAEQSIGPIEGCENVIIAGRVAGESIRWDPVAGQVHFTVYGPHYWLNRIKVSACQLNFSQAPTDWDQVQDLNVDRGLWHLLHWRSTATTIMDFYRTSDTRYASKLATLANFLWSQLTEFAGLQLMAHVLCDRYGRLFAEIDPQMVPAGSRTWPTVMTVTTDDWMDVIDFERVTVHETGQVNITTRVVNASGASATLYSLSPGHIPRKHGEWELNDGMLAASQAGSNQMAGLLLGWKNNSYPNIPLKLAENNRMIDICPRQFLDITIDAADTPRGISYDGNIIPRRVALRYNAEERSLIVEVNSEGETFEQVSSNGDVPGSSNVDLSFPPLPGLPPLPDIPIIIPGTVEFDEEAEMPAIMHDVTKGLLYTENMNTANPQYIAINSGLIDSQYQQINNFFVTPNGALYAAYVRGVDDGNYASRPFFIARAPSIGGTFTVLYDEPSIRPSPFAGKNWGLWAVGYNPLVSEQVGFVMGTCNVDKKFWIGAGASFAAGAVVDTSSFVVGGLTYGFGAWLYTRLAHFSKIASGGGSVITTGSPAIDNLVTSGTPLTGHIRAGSGARTFHMKQGGGGLVVGDNNLASIITYTYSPTAFFGIGLACDPTGTYLMGRHDTGNKGKSSDSGATWLALSSLPPGNWWWSYAGSPQWWVAAGGSSVRMTQDFGTTWLNREGNLLSIAPAPNINMIKMVGF